MTAVISWILVSIASLYGAFLLWCLAGWRRLGKQEDLLRPNQVFSTPVTVIIPARNEEAHLEACLMGLARQQYPPSLLEVIIVNDHSTDRTKEIAEAFILRNERPKFRILNMHDEPHGSLFKKKAITEAVNLSTGSLLVTTDADCRHDMHWVSSHANRFEAQGPVMISAPVLFDQEKNIFEKMQSLEFIGLIAIGAAGIAHGKPFLCNGANLAFTKKIFEDVNGYQTGDALASGDDTQLLFKVADTRSGKIQFLKSRQAIVRTAPKHSLPDFFHQRKRWASKVPVQMTRFILAVAVIAWLLHFGILAAALVAVVSGKFMLLVIPMTIKMSAEFLLLANATGFFRKNKLLWLFLPAQILYPFYIVVIGLASLSGTYEWKGRKAR